jgi:hypothetical protein
MPMWRLDRSISGGRAAGEGGDQMDFIAVRQDLSLDGLAAVHHQQDGLVIAGNRYMIQQFGARARIRERYVQTP